MPYFFQKQNFKQKTPSSVICVEVSYTAQMTSASLDTLFVLQLANWKRLSEFSQK